MTSVSSSRDDSATVQFTFRRDRLWSNTITVAALEGRVRRRLTESGQLLRKCRTDSRWYSDLGDYYITEATTNTLVAAHVDLESLAKELGALRDGKVVQE